FAPAERLDEAAIYRQSRLILDQELLSELYEAVMNAVVIVNEYRQIVYCNQHFALLTGSDNPVEIYGMRIGEAVGCVHSDEEEGGCGTAEACAVCGAANAILDGQQGRLRVREASIRKQDGSQDINIELKASPLQQNGESFVILAINDINDRFRRQALERIFFHDLMNTASGLKMLSEQIADNCGDATIAPFRDRLQNGVSYLMEEIREQRSLLAAETEALELSPKPCRSIRLLEDLAGFYRNFEMAEEKEIVIEEDSENIAFKTDPALVFRVIGNMVKNALEASGPGQRVAMACSRAEDGLLFSVHNPAYMPRKVQLQIFHRSFTTKAAGRGLGTYSMKLLTEHYLMGRIWFSSTRKNGTCFRLWLPFAPDACR
ncbi:MAG TPA: ATP-binding protein, partial [Desulfosalsimonadaceae bacterium]|nr:ATP-binding protein [Desulfosalsimonadaceae bacterium]